MLRALGLLVAISIALLLWAVPSSGSHSSTHREAVPARAAPPASAATESRWIDRPVPRIAEEPHRADLVDPPDSPDDAVEPSEPDRPVDPGPLQVVEGPTQAEARPEYAPTAADEALVARAVDLLDRLFSAIESNADNCDRMGDSLSELLTSSTDLIAESKAMANQPTRARWFESRMMAKMTAWSERIMKPLQSCMSNERVMAALKPLAV